MRFVATPDPERPLLVSSSGGRLGSGSPGLALERLPRLPRLPRPLSLGDSCAEGESPGGDTAVELTAPVSLLLGDVSDAVVWVLIEALSERGKLTAAGAPIAVRSWCSWLSRRGTPGFEPLDDLPAAAAVAWYPFLSPLLLLRELLPLKLGEPSQLTRDRELMRLLGVITLTAPPPRLETLAPIKVEVNSPSVSKLGRCRKRFAVGE